MSGLIWAGLGKGIADAGSTYGNAMFRAAEAEEADQRALQKAEALERLKDKLSEERSQRDADIYSRAQTRAGEMATNRQTQQLETDSGKLAANAQSIAGDAPAMSQDDMKRHLESLNPSERKALEGTGLIGRAASPLRQELQSYEDTIAAARELGGSSTMIKSLQDAKKERLAEIRAELKDQGEKEEREQNRRRLDQQDRRLDQMAEYQGRMAGAAERRAEAAVTSANKPSGKGTDAGDKPINGVDLERAAKAAEKALALELGVPVKDLQSEVARLKKRNQLSPEAQTRLDSYNSALTRWQNYKSTSKSPKGSDNSSTRPPLSSFMR